MTRPRLRSVAAAASAATLATLTLATGVLACETQRHDSDGSGTKQAAAGCTQSGNALLQQISFHTGSGSHSSLGGHVSSGDTVSATFTVPEHCSVEVSLVSYQAPSAAFDANTADQQKVFSSKDVTVGAGSHSLQVTVPACYFQVDFVRGSIIQHLGPAGSSNFYSKQGRLISSDNGGTRSCAQTPATGSGGGSSPCAANPQLSNVTYLLGGTTTVTNLRDHVTSGETVRALFSVPAGCTMQLSLASYQAPLPHFTRESAPQQKLYDSQTGSFGAGQHSMQVTVPSCMFQVDFVHGAVLTTIGSTTDTEYGSRLISADNGGSVSCNAAPSPSPSPTTAPTASPSPSTPPVTGGNGGSQSPPPPSASATPTHSATASPTPGGVQGITDTAPAAPAAATASTPSTGAHLALGAAAILVLVGLGLLFASRVRRDVI